MPNPKDAAQQSASAAHEEMAAMFGDRQQNSLSREIAALREDIADLRAALIPVPSLILTGQQALDEFKRLTGARP